MSEHHYGPPSRDAMHGDPRTVAPPQGGLRIDVAFPQHHAGHFYQYDPAVHGQSGPHATYGTAMSRGSQHPSFDNHATMYAGAGAQRGAPQPPIGHTANVMHGGYVAPYGPPYVRGARSQISDDNIDPRLRCPDSSERSFFRLSKVTDQEWRSSSPEDDDDGDIGPGRGYYGRLPTTMTARYPSTDNTTTPTSETLSIAQWQEDDNYVAPEQETRPAPAPAPASTVAPEMAPPAVPERPLRKARAPEKSARTIVPAPKGTVVRRRSCRKAAAGKNPSLPTPSTTTTAATPEVGPSSSTAKGGKGKKRALEGDVPASAVKRRKGAQLEPEPEASPSTSSADASTSTTPAAEASAETMECLWAGCGKSVLATEQNLTMHLKGCHVKAVEDQDESPCRWDGCSKKMKSSSIPRHVTSNHLTLGAGHCKVCGANLSRMDSGDRHQKKSCCRCKDCKKKCASLAELDEHRRLHCPGKAKKAKKQ